MLIKKYYWKMSSCFLYRNWNLFSTEKSDIYWTQDIFKTFISFLKSLWKLCLSLNCEGSSYLIMIVWSDFCLAPVNFHSCLPLMQINLYLFGSHLVSDQKKISSLFFHTHIHPLFD